MKITEPMGADEEGGPRTGPKDMDDDPAKKTSKKQLYKQKESQESTKTQGESIQKEGMVNRVKHSREIKKDEDQDN